MYTEQGREWDGNRSFVRLRFRRPTSAKLSRAVKADEISSYIHHPVEKIADREQAIKAAMSVTSQELDAVIIAGKGADCYQIIQGKKEDYPGDAAVAERYL